MTKHDLKELAAMGAELGAAKAENERLREVLSRIANLPMYQCSTENDYRLSAAKAMAVGALTHQADPTETTEAYTAVDMATAAAQGFRDGQAAVEPAPAQDEREAYQVGDPVVLHDGRRGTIKQLIPNKAKGFVIELSPGFGGTYGDWEFTRPAQTEQPEQSEPNRRTLQWVVDRWHAEVANRPLVNVHRRTLDSTWRQMIRHLGEDDVVLLGPRHDDMLDASGNPLPQYAAALNATQQENSHE